MLFETFGHVLIISHEDKQILVNKVWSLFRRHLSDK